MDDTPPGTGFALKRALDNYVAERHRLVGGHYPHISCSCAFCDCIRAADLLYRVVAAEYPPPVSLGRLRASPERRLRN